MKLMSEWIAPHRLEAVHKELASESTPVLDFLRRKLADKPNSSLREYAELREARTLINIVKYAGFNALVRADEMTWALQYARDVYARESALGSVLFVEKAARLLGLDLKTPAPMPLDLSRRIHNELALLSKPPIEAMAHAS